MVVCLCVWMCVFVWDCTQARASGVRVCWSAVLYPHICMRHSGCDTYYLRHLMVDNVSVSNSVPFRIQLFTSPWKYIQMFTLYTSMEVYTNAHYIYASLCVCVCVCVCVFSGHLFLQTHAAGGAHIFLLSRYEGGLIFCSRISLLCPIWEVAPARWQM